MKFNQFFTQLRVKKKNETGLKVKGIVEKRSKQKKSCHEKVLIGKK